SADSVEYFSENYQITTVDCYNGYLAIFDSKNLITSFYKIVQSNDLILPKLNQSNSQTGLLNESNSMSIFSTPKSYGKNTPRTRHKTLNDSNLFNNSYNISAVKNPLSVKKCSTPLLNTSKKLNDDSFQSLFRLKLSMSQTRDSESNFVYSFAKSGKSVTLEAPDFYLKKIFSDPSTK
ncbi:MAG: hypothetical protein MHPSP_004204, partial [Paramarteilia canceri]